MVDFGSTIPPVISAGISSSMIAGTRVVLLLEFLDCVAPYLKLDHAAKLQLVLHESCSFHQGYCH